MNDIWLDYNATTFEELAVEYANAVFPEWNWVGTQQTRDGGKDGTAVIFEQQTNMGTFKKEAWVEAKYTKKHQRSIPLSRIASTVLIGHNKRDLVEILLIVTNASFSENTVHEIHLIFGNRVMFISGQDLLLWLQNRNQSFALNNHLLSRQCDNNLFYTIGNPLIVRKDVLCQSVSSYSERLILGEKYDLFITLNVSILSKIKLQFEIAEYTDYITIHNNPIIDAHIGTNFISIPFIASKTGTITKKNIFLTLREINTSKSIEIRIARDIEHNHRIDILCKSQGECSQILLQHYDSFHNKEKGIFFNLIEGAAGHGKTYILTDFIQNRQNSEYIFIKFNHNNEFSNSILLIRLLTFIVWGRFFSENILCDDDPEELENEIQRLQQICEYNKDYTEYLRYMSDKDNALEIINKLCDKKDLIPPTTCNTDEKIIILDDLQFLENRTSQFLLHLFEQENLSGYKIFCIIAKRPGQLNLYQLDEFIKIYNSQLLFNIHLTEDDVYHSLLINGLNNLPSSLFPKLARNVFILKEFIAIAKVLENKHPIAILKNPEIKRLLTEQRQIPFIYGNFSDGSKKIIDIVYFFKTGVDASYLYSRYSDTAIDALVYKNVIKNSLTGYVPYHDLILESISAIIKYDSEHIYDYAVYKLQKGCIVEYFSVLGFFPSKFDRNKEDFVSLITSLHYEQKYANVYYILHRFFSIKHYHTILYNKYHHALLLFYYAYAMFNVGNRNGLDVFEQALAQLGDSHQSEQEKTLSNLILSEIANCHYWELNFDSIIQKYNVISKIFTQKEQKQKEDWIAYFTISTRYISSLFFMDKDDDASAVYLSTMSQVQDPEIEKLAMYVITSYNEANFVNNALRAHSHIKNFMDKYFEDMPIKNKFVIKSTYLFMDIMLGYSPIKELEQWIEWGKEQSLEYNYKITKLDLAICYALKGEYEKLEQNIHSIIDIRDFPILACGKYYNLEALVHLYKGQYALALSCLNEQERCFNKLGKSFRDKIYRNKQLVKSMPQKIDVNYKLQTQSTFYIEIRL